MKKTLLFIVELLKAKFDFKNIKNTESNFKFVKHSDQMLSNQEKFWRVILMVVTRRRSSRLIVRITSLKTLLKVRKLNLKVSFQIKFYLQEKLLKSRFLTLIMNICLMVGGQSSKMFLKVVKKSFRFSVYRSLSNLKYIFQTFDMTTIEISEPSLIAF